MGGGGGDTRTTGTNDYPPEFRPLAAAAAGQIKDFQGLLPLSHFAASHPQQTAGISPFQQAGMGLIPSLLNPLPALHQLRGYGQPINLAAAQAFDMGQRTPSAQAALHSLANSGRVPSYATMLPSGSPSFLFRGALPSPVTSSQSLIPGMTQGDVDTLQGHLARSISAGSPVLGPTLPSPDVLTTLTQAILTTLPDTVKNPSPASTRPPIDYVVRRDLIDAPGQYGYYASDSGGNFLSPLQFFSQADFDAMPTPPQIVV